MNRTRLISILLLMAVGLLVAACGGSGPEVDRVGTRVAEELAVVATLTAAAPAPQTELTSAPPEPTATLTPTADAVAEAPADTATTAPIVTPIEVAVDPPATQTPSPVPPTNTPPPAPTNTPPPVPTNTPPPPPPSPTPILIAVLPVDGGGGDVPNIRNNNPVKGGRNVTIPGFSQAQVTEPMVFRDRVAFQAEVFDANIGTNDGDGIENVTFTILDNNGNQVHQRTENNAGYCVFGGGEPDCSVWVFAEHNNRWPDGAPISGGLHDVSIDINPYHGDDVNWMWSFTIALPAVDSARINNIHIQGDRYMVDFETSGFTPKLPGQHVHFFFDTVPPDQAGVPGKGPWILYGGPSPFTEYGVGDRPAGATQMCILVANPDHSVQPHSGNCFPLP